MASTAPRAVEARIDGLDLSVCTVPTDQPESDGTLEWDSTTIVIVEAHAGGEKGIGWTYGSPACATMIDAKLRDAVTGRDALDVPAAWLEMQGTIRNEGRTGTAAMAISAVDTALWDLAARLADLPLCSLLGRFHEEVPVYGSGGFCSYSNERLAEQLAGWAEQGIPRVKMKVGRDKDADRERARVAREAIGPDVALFVDGNGGYSRKEALYWAHVFAEEHGSTYFEEPVSSDDLAGLAQLRDHGPPGMDVAAGEYGYRVAYFAHMVDCVDIQQADVTRCGGITPLREIGGLCQAHQVPFSAHCSPALHAHAASAIQPLLHLEYFHDHVRIESMLFDGTLSPEGGALRPDLSRPGNGLEVKRSEVERYAV